jgi:vitamin B12 transporter
VRASVARPGGRIATLGVAFALALVGEQRLGAPAFAQAPSAPVAGPAIASSSTSDVGAETIVIVEGTPDAEARHRRRALGSAPFVTIVEPADRRGQLLSVAEALSSTVGAQVRSAGGVGASASISIRGASSGHTSVLVDGISLSRLTAVSVDLGRFRLDELDAVEVYRGNVPAELGGGGVGGAVNLVTHLGRGRGGERLRASAGVGSYGARRLAARFGDTLRLGDAGLDVTASAGYLAADGDYRVFSDAGTPLNTTDDSWQTRQNNQARQLDAVVRAGAADRSPERGVIAGVRFSWHRHGLPGLIAAPAYSASLATAVGLADLELRRSIAGWATRHRAWGTVEHQRFRDRENEIGLAAQDRDYTTFGGGAGSHWQRRLATHQLQAGAEVRLERFRDRDRWMNGPTSLGSRQTLALAVGDELAEDDWLVAAVLRLEVSRTAPAVPPDGLADPGDARFDPRYELLPSPRVTGRILAEEDLAVKASAGWYARQPTLVEMFGDRGFLVGTPELKPETGPSFDLGLVWAPARAHGPVDRTLVEVAGFYNRASDAILYVNTGFVARPMNAGAAQNFGLELSATTRLLRFLSVVANTTLQMSEQLEDEASFDGKDLPRHPRHTAYGRLEAEARWWGRQLRGYGDAHYTAESYLDRAGLQRVPSRASLGAGAGVELARQLVLSVEVKNLLDRQIERFPLEPPPRPDFTSTPVAISDISGLPLPGRHLFVSLEWSR